ncbi:MAG: helix-turn-helix transcriptional regulator [Eubacteriales bacterium]|nr:helix-turn-helix transcriptional regulator [Eubacteriales bacterium]
MKQLGKHIATLRKQRGLTQEALAEALGVSPQAVSKWETDTSCPDISLLPKLAAELGVTVDALLAGDMPVQLVPQEQRKNIDDMLLHVIVDSPQGDKVRVNLPMALVKVGLEIAKFIPQGQDADILRQIDIEQILLMIDSGMIGKLVEVEAADGTCVEVVVE